MGFNLKGKLMDNEKLSFEQWSEAMMALVNAHPAMGPDSTCPVRCAFIEESMRKVYDIGVTIESAYDQIDEFFSIYGW